MKYKYIISGIFLAALLAVPSMSQAATFFWQQETIRPAQEIKDDVYAVGRDLDFEHPVRGDVLAAGLNIEIRNNVDGDIFAAGQMITIVGNVKDDIHAAAASVEVRGVTQGEVFAAGRRIQIDPESKIQGDVFATGEEIQLNGIIHGTVHVAGPTRVLAGTVIEGDLISYGDQPVVEAGATVKGQTRVENEQQKEAPRFDVMQWVRRVITYFIFSLILLHLFRGYTARTLLTLWARPRLSVLTGFLWLLAFIPLSILLIITLLGLPLAIILLLTTVILYILAIPLTCIVIGYWVMGRVNRAAAPADKPAIMSLSWPHALLGTIIYQGFTLLGPIGWVVTFLFTVVVFGALLITTWNQLGQRTVVIAQPK
jgi:cytoskeletal protein CcmA (bactofilin family)